MRREVLARIGGFISIADQLADDYRLGQLTRRMGLHTVLSEVVGRDGGRRARRCRPGTARAALAAHYSGGTSAGLRASPSSPSVWRRPPSGLCWRPAPGPTLTMLGVTAVARILIALHRARGELRSALLQFWIVPLTDLLNFALWARGFLVRRVQWRHARYRIARDGSAHAIP